MAKFWLVVGLAVVVVAGVMIIVLTGAANCPKGQHQVLVRYQPIITVVNKIPIVQEIPIYACER